MQDELRTKIYNERGAMCECCGMRQWTELHHCLVHDNKRLHKAITVPENLMAVCRTCHQYLNGHEIRRIFALKQIERGYDIAKWYNSLKMKNKEAWLLQIGDNDAA